MNRFERRLFARSVALGLILTLLTLIAQQLGFLSSLDNWFYDLRVSLCQHYAPPPTDRIVHVDIDDASLETIGHWPWPWATLARILDEIDRAQPKVVVLDILFGEAQPPRYVPTTQPQGQWVDDNAVLAQSIGRLNNMLVAVSFKFAAPVREPADAVAQDALFENLELTPAELALKLAANKITSTREESIDDLLLRSRRLAMRRRIERELNDANLTRDQLIARLLPHTDPTIRSPILRLLDEERAAVEAARKLRRFALIAPPMPVMPVQGTPDVVPIPIISASAKGIGVIDYDIFSSATVRSTPLFVEHQGRLYPQIGLAMGCALLGADVTKSRIVGNTVVIPCPDGRKISIPTYHYQSQTLGHDVSLINDIPWFGTHDWATMYDWPAHRHSVNHISIVQVWDICTTLDKIAQNNTNIDSAISTVLGDASDYSLRIDPDMAHRYAAALPPIEDFTDRQTMAQAALKQLTDSHFLELFQKIPESQRTENDRVQIAELQAADQAFRQLIPQNQLLHTQLDQQRAQLKAQIQDKGVLIGSTATGAQDAVSTSLHARCPGVVVHGVIANAVVTGHWWRQSPPWLIVVLILLIGTITAAINAALPPLPATFASVAMLSAYLLIDGPLLFDFGGLIVPVAGPVIAIVAVWIGCTLYQLMVEHFERVRIGTEHALINREMELARQVQIALIPARAPHIAGLESEGWALAASMTGGDCFDLWALPDGRLAILLADASGHGLAPAMIVSQVRTLVRALSESESHPQNLLQRVNNRLSDDLESSRFVTAFLGFLAPDGKLEWASAGHGPMYWCSDSRGEMLTLESTGLPLGIQTDWIGDQAEPLQLDPHGMLVVFSDGIFEAHSPAGEMFTAERVRDMLSKSCLAPCTQIIAELRTAVQQWQGKTEPADDQTVVIARRLAPTPAAETPESAMP